MGIDYLDLTFQLEKRFNVKIHREDQQLLIPAWTSRRPPDFTAGEVHDWILKICKARNVPIPHSSWNRVRVVIATVTGKSPHIIHRETLLVRDLGFG